MSAKSDEDYDYLFKVVMIGDSGVGKSNIVSRYAGNEFRTDHTPTTGVDFTSTSYYRGTVGVVLVYDVTKRGSYDHIVEHWYPEMREHTDHDVVVILVGNKTDLRHSRSLDSEEAKAFAESKNMLFIETSAMDPSNLNVDVAFTTLLTEIYRKNVSAKDK